MNTRPEALLTTRPDFGRLAALVRDEGAVMAELGYEQLQAQALSNAENAYAAALNGRHDAADSLKAQAQTQALLAIGAALRDLTRAVQDGRQ